MKPKTTTLTAVIVDDEEDAIEVLTEALQSQCPEIDVLASASSAQEGLKALELHDPDILFLDVQMPKGSGFDLLKKAPQRSFRTIFVSAHASHAVEAVKFHAMAYLLKPVSGDDLREAVDLCTESIDNDSAYDYEALLENIPQSSSKRIAIPTGSGYRYFEPGEIIRVEAARSYSNVHTIDSPKPLLVSRNLKQFDNLLTSRGFMRVHNAHLVNTTCIREFKRQDGGTIVLSDGQSLLVGRHYRQHVVDYLGNGADFV